MKVEIVQAESISELDDSNDKKIVKKAESLFDEIEIRSFSYEL